MSNLRDQTLNRLNNVSFCIPNTPIPASVMPLSIFEEMMYKVAYENGYSGTKTDFTEDFVNVLLANIATGAQVNVVEGTLLDPDR